MRNNIDDIFKDKFSQFEAPVSDGLWDKIQENPQWGKNIRKRKIKKLSIYAALTTIVISTCVVLLLHKSAPSNENFDTSLIAEQRTNEVQQPTIDNTATTALTEETTVNNTTENDPITAVTSNSSNPNTNTISIVDETSLNPIPNKTETTENQENKTTSTSSTSSTPGIKTPSTDKPTKSQSNNTSKTDNKGGDTPNSDMSSSNNNSASPAPENQNHSLFSIPNAFTPNGDGLNDVFRPVTAASILQYQLDIFSMNGQHLFSSKSIEYGWNGEFQGGMMDNGSYVYIIKYKDDNGKEHIDKGQLLLIR